MARETNVKMTPGNVPGQEQETTETDGEKEPTLKDLMTLIQAQNARIDGLGRFTTALKITTEELKKGTPATKTEEKPEEKSLTERQRKLEQEWAQKTQKARDRAIKQMIASALHNEGITDAAEATRKASFLKSEFADRIAVDDDTDAVTIDDGGQQVDVQKYLHAYLQTEDGQWLAPKKSPPNDRAAAKGFGHSSGKVSADGKVQLTREEYSSKDKSPAVRKAIASGQFEIV